MTVRAARAAAFVQYRERFVLHRKSRQTDGRGPQRAHGRPDYFKFKALFARRCSLGLPTIADNRRQSDEQMPDQGLQAPTNGVVFIHGVGGSALAWQPQVESFRAAG